MLSINDILNPVVGKADFLCQNLPSVCVEELTVFPTTRMRGAFLLEGTSNEK